MKEKYYLFDILANEKQMVANTAIALNEASCDLIYDTYFDMFKKLSKEAKDLFNIAFNNDWYSLTEVEDKILDDEIKKLEADLNDCI